MISPVAAHRPDTIQRVPEGPAWSGLLPDELNLHRKVVKIEQFTGYSADFRPVLLRRHALEMRADQQIAVRKKPGRALRTRPGQVAPESVRRDAESGNVRFWQTGTPRSGAYSNSVTSRTRRSGFVIGAKRARTTPALSTRNFVKFHFMLLRSNPPFCCLSQT
jgi:hypothetical protein